MSSQDPSGRVDDALAGIVAPLIAEYSSLTDRRKQLGREVMGIDRQMTRLRKVLRAAGVTPNGDVPQARADGKPKSSGATVAAWRAPAVAEAVATSPDGMTIRDVAEALDWNRATVEISMRMAREQGLVRLAGQRPGPGGHGKSKIYRTTGKEASKPT